MLAVVRGPAEADAVVAGGADAVVSASPTSADFRLLVQQTLSAVDGRVPVCAVMPDDADVGFDAIAAAARAGLRFLVVPAGLVRAVLPACAGRLAVLARCGTLPTGQDLDAARDHGAVGVLFDPPGRCLEAARIHELAGFVEACGLRGLLAALSGSLEAPDVPRLLALAPDALVFDRALRTTPEAAPDPGAITLIRDLVPIGEAGMFGVAAEVPRIAGPDAPARPASGPADRIFVRDLVLPMEIGAYASEKGRNQRVRFTVEADLAPAPRHAGDLRDVVSYDLIGDTVRQLAAAGHVELVETLAERIAERLLLHPRIRVVRVVVEKLDLGPGSVGVEITRQQTGAAVS